MDQAVRNLVDLTNPADNFILNMDQAEAARRVASGDPQAVAGIEGQFAIVARDGDRIRMARSIGRLLRYFIAKRQDGPMLIVAQRIEPIRACLEELGLLDQFHPSYTRMAPAHYVTEVHLVGCPDPNPVYRRFFDPPQDVWQSDVEAIGRRYIEALATAIDGWLDRVPAEAPIGVCFSGGIDSGAVFLTTYHAMKARGDNLSRLKAFTLSVDGRGEDLVQARRFLDSVDLGLFLEPIEVSGDAVNPLEAVRVIEDYKPLDIQAGAVLLALCRAIRQRYRDWKYLIDGDGGDENLKDYPIEINPELTIHSVLNNRMLYQEGWGVGSIKHSLTFSGGHSRAYARTAGPLAATGFVGFSPFTVPNVIAVAEGIPYRALTGFDVDRLYELKGQVVAAGVRAVTGLQLPVFEKRRFQHGAGRIRDFDEPLAAQERRYYKAFQDEFVPAAD